MKRCVTFRKINDGEHVGPCQEKDFHAMGPCKNKAEWVFHGWQFGDVEKGEKSFAKVVFYFCNECRERMDEAIDAVAYKRMVS